MGAFILAGIVAIATLVLSGIMLFAAGMSSSPNASDNVPIASTFFVGMILAALIAASHWMPSIGW